MLPVGESFTTKASWQGSPVQARPEPVLQAVAGGEVGRAGAADDVDVAAGSTVTALAMSMSTPPSWVLHSIRLPSAAILVTKASTIATWPRVPAPTRGKSSDRVKPVT